MASSSSFWRDVGPVLRHIYDPIFMFNFWVARKPVSAKTFKAVMAKEGITWEVSKTANGNTSFYDRGDSTVGVVWYNDRQSLTHELVHSACFALWRRGIRGGDNKNDSYDEILAYYVGFLERCIKAKR